MGLFHTSWCAASASSFSRCMDSETAPFNLIRTHGPLGWTLLRVRTRTHVFNWASRPANIRRGTERKMTEFPPKKMTGRSNILYSRNRYCVSFKKKKVLSDEIISSTAVPATMIQCYYYISIYMPRAVAHMPVPAIGCLFIFHAANPLDV